MSEVQSQQIAGGFILITGQDGIRYALLPTQVAVIHDDHVDVGEDLPTNAKQILGFLRHQGAEVYWKARHRQ